jgi:hypothetical protein
MHGFLLVREIGVSLLKNQGFPDGVLIISLTIYKKESLVKVGWARPTDSLSGTCFFLVPMLLQGNPI